MSNFSCAKCGAAWIDKSWLGYDPGCAHTMEEAMDTKVDHAANLRRIAVYRETHPDDRDMIFEAADEIDRLGKEQGEYICKCGIRVSPHRCIEGGF